MENVLRGRRYLWKIKKPEERLVTEYSVGYGLSRPVAHFLAARAGNDRAAAELLLGRRYFPMEKPERLGGVKKAVDEIFDAVERKEKILVFGDYDVDGVTSTSIMLLALKQLGANVSFYIPQRAIDGYGISARAVEAAYRKGFRTIVTVDNGIAAVDAGEAAKKLGVRLIITDHHEPQEIIPWARVIVNPKLPENDGYPTRELAGAGVALKVAELIFNRTGKTPPDKIYELAGLGTVADAVPITFENREIVRRALSVLNGRTSNAIAMLFNRAGINPTRIRSRDIAFTIAPHINAAGRLGSASPAVRMLISRNDAEVAVIAAQLVDANKARKEMEQKMTARIIENLLGKPEFQSEPAVIEKGKGWHVGIIGLVAGRIASETGRPTILLKESGENLHGSARSAAGISVLDALRENANFLDRFGGHAAAAGLALSSRNFGDFRKGVMESVARILGEGVPEPEIAVEIEAELPEVDFRLVNELDMMEPFGVGNEQPLILVKRAQVIEEPRVFGGKHVAVTLLQGGTTRRVVFFNYADAADVVKKSNRIDVVAIAALNEWGGRRRVELHGIDLRESGTLN